MQHTHFDAQNDIYSSFHGIGFIQKRQSFPFIWSVELLPIKLCLYAYNAMPFYQQSYVLAIVKQYYNEVRTRRVALLDQQKASQIMQHAVSPHDAVHQMPAPSMKSVCLTGLDCRICDWGATSCVIHRLPPMTE